MNQISCDGRYASTNIFPMKILPQPQQMIIDSPYVTIKEDGNEAFLQSIIFQQK